MLFLIVKKIVMFVPNKLIAINNSVDKLLAMLNKTEKTFTYVKKIIGASTGSAGVAKVTADFAEAIACQDEIYATVLVVGVVADGL